MFTDDQVTVGGSVVTSLQIKSECDAVGKVDDNEVIGKTNPIIYANSDTSACTYSSKGSGSYISFPASLESDADTNKNENDSPLEEITTVTFPYAVCHLYLQLVVKGILTIIIVKVMVIEIAA